MWSWWNSVEAVDAANLVAKWVGAMVGISIVVLGHRLATLQGIAKALEKQKNEQAAITASNQTVRAESELQATRKELEETSKKAAILEAKQKPRTLTEDQSKTLIEALRLVERCPIDFVIMAGDPDTFEFAEKIENALARAGFKINRTESMPFLRPPVGLSLYVQSQENAPELAGILQKTMERFGFHCDGRVDPNTKSGHVGLLVGKKPIY